MSSHQQQVQCLNSWLFGIFSVFTPVYQAIGVISQISKQNDKIKIQKLQEQSKTIKICIVLGYMYSLLSSDKITALTC